MGNTYGTKWKSVVIEVFEIISTLVDRIAEPILLFFHLFFFLAILFFLPIVLNISLII